MHQIDHRNRCVRFGKCRRDGCECAWPETQTAELGRQRQPKEPGSPERINGFGGEPGLLVVLPGSRGQYLIGYLSCLSKALFHDSICPRIYGWAWRSLRCTLLTMMMLRFAGTRGRCRRRSRSWISGLSYHAQTEHGSQQEDEFCHSLF